MSGSCVCPAQDPAKGKNMAYQWKGFDDWNEHKRKCRESAAVRCSDNIYEQMRVRIVRVVREEEYCIELAAEKLGISENTVRKYLRFVPFEHLMRDPSLENRFDWRSMTGEKWTKLLRKHPQFITRLPKDILGCRDEMEILIAQPQLGSYFDLSEWNRLELGFNWAELLSSRPQFADQCDFSVVTARAAADLLEKQPQFFDRIPLETLWAYHWTEIFRWQPQLEKKMLEKPHSEWPFNFWVHALQYHPELEAEFDGWDKIEDQDIPDFKRTQPEMYKRHWPEKKEK